MKKLAGLLALSALFAMPLCSCTIGGDEGENEEEKGSTTLKSVAYDYFEAVTGESVEDLGGVGDYEDEEDEEHCVFQYSESGLKFYFLSYESEEKEGSALMSYLVGKLPSGKKSLEDPIVEDDDGYYGEKIYEANKYVYDLIVEDSYYGVYVVAKSQYSAYNEYFGGGSGSESEELDAIISQVENTFSIEFEYYDYYLMYYAESLTTKSLEQSVVDAASKVTFMEIDGEVEEYNDEESGLSGYEAYFYDESGNIELNIYSCEEDGDVYLCFSIVDYSSFDF